MQIFGHMVNYSPARIRKFARSRNGCLYPAELYQGLRTKSTEFARSPIFKGLSYVLEAHFV